MQLHIILLYIITIKDKCGNLYEIPYTGVVPPTSVSLEMPAFGCDAGASSGTANFTLNIPVDGYPYTVSINNGANALFTANNSNIYTYTTPTAGDWDFYKKVLGQITGLQPNTAYTFVITGGDPSCPFTYSNTFTTGDASFQIPEVFYYYQYCNASQNINDVSFIMAAVVVNGVTYTPNQIEFPDVNGLFPGELGFDITTQPNPLTLLNTPLTDEYSTPLISIVNTMLSPDHTLRVKIVNSCGGFHYLYWKVVKNWDVPPSIAISAENGNDCLNSGSIKIDYQGSFAPQFDFECGWVQYGCSTLVPATFANNTLHNDMIFGGAYGQGYRGWAIKILSSPPGSGLADGITYYPPLNPALDPISGNPAPNDFWIDTDGSIGNTDFQITNLTVSGTYTFELWATGDCHSQTVNVDVVGLSTLPNVQVDPVVSCNFNPCLNITAHATNGNPDWTWSLLNAQTNNQVMLPVTTSSPDHTFPFCGHSTNATYHVRVADRCGNAVISEPISPNPAIDFPPMIFGEETICPNQNVVLTALSPSGDIINFPGINFEWFTSPTGSAPWTPVQSGSSNQYTLVNLTSNTFVRVRYSIPSTDGNPDCSSSYSGIFEVIVSNPFTVTLNGPGLVCTPYDVENPLEVTATHTATSSPLTIDWTDPNGGALAQYDGTNTCNLTVEGEYQVVITDANGCAVTGAFNFQIFDSPVASAGADIISCGPITNPVLGPAQNLYAGQFPNSFSWTPVLNLSDPISTSPTYNGVISTTTTFQVEVTNRFGCTDTDEMQVIISAVPSCVATDLDSQPLTSIELCLGESIEFVVDCPNGTPELDNPPLGNLTFNRNTGHWTFESTGGGSGNIVFTYPDPDGTGGCPEGSLVIPVTVQNLPFLACGDDIVICDDMPLQTNISAPLNDV